MHNVQEIRELIITLLKKKKISASKMLTDCGYTTSLVSDMKKGQMPSADKIVTIANYLGVSTDYLMGATDDPMPQKKDITPEDLLSYRISKLSPRQRKMIEDLTETFEEEASTASSSVISRTTGINPVQ